MCPEWIWNGTLQKDDDAFRRLVPVVVSGVQRSAAALAAAGNHLILGAILARADRALRASGLSRPRPGHMPAASAFASL
jgi:hypothetical protein